MTGSHIVSKILYYFGPNRFSASSYMCTVLFRKQQCKLVRKECQAMIRQKDIEIIIPPILIFKGQESHTLFIVFLTLQLCFHAIVTSELDPKEPFKYLRKKFSTLKLIYFPLLLFRRLLAICRF